MKFKPLVLDPSLRPLVEQTSAKPATPQTSFSLAFTQALKAAEQKSDLAPTGEVQIPELKPAKVIPISKKAAPQKTIRFGELLEPASQYFRRHWPAIALSFMMGLIAARLTELPQSDAAEEPTIAEAVAVAPKVAEPSSIPVVSEPPTLRPVAPSKPAVKAAAKAPSKLRAAMKPAKNAKSGAKRRPAAKASGGKSR